MSSLKCDICNYETTRNDNIQRHFLSKKHLINIGSAKKAEPKTYKCAECEYISTRKANLERHVEAEHLNKKIRCEYCDLTCKVCEYNEHMKSEMHYENVIIQKVTYSARCQTMIKNKLTSIERLQDNKISIDKILERLNSEELKRYNSSKSLLAKHDNELLKIRNVMNGENTRPELIVKVKISKENKEEKEEKKDKKDKKISGEEMCMKLKTHYLDKLKQLKDSNIDYQIDEDYYNGLFDESFLKIEDLKQEINYIVQKIDNALESN